MDSAMAVWPQFSEEEAAAVRNVILSNKVNYWTGTEGREFEREFAAWVGTEHAVALANGTLALEFSLKALGIRSGDEVIVTPRTFLASASCIVSIGAIPVFADVDRESQNITAETISEVISERTRAIICVHLAGLPCDMDPIMKLARERGIFVVEDCAQAHGARYKKRMVGSIGDIGVWSFCQDKILTTGGEGGMATTNDSFFWKSMWSYKDHGKSWEAVYACTQATGFRWVHESFGTNGRMMEIQAVIGRIQLLHMSAWTAKRQSNAKKLADVCKQWNVVRLCVHPADIDHAFYKFYAFVEPRNLAFGWSRDRIIEEILSRGVFCSHGSCPEVYLEKAFDNKSYRPTERLKIAKELGETSLMFQVHPTLTESDLAKTCRAIDSVLRMAQCPD